MKVSIGETLAVVAWIALNLAGLVSHVSISWIAVLVNFAAVTAFAISALVAVGPHRAVSITFVVPVIVYGVLVLTISDDELAMRAGQLPTSRVFQLMLKPNYGNGPTGVAVIHRKEHAESLMPCGHSAVAVLFGYLAGKYGRWVHRWTTQE